MPGSLSHAGSATWGSGSSLTEGDHPCGWWVRATGVISNLTFSSLQKEHLSLPFPGCLHLDPPECLLPPLFEPWEGLGNKTAKKTIWEYYRYHQACKAVFTHASECSIFTDDETTNRIVDLMY